MRGTNRERASLIAFGGVAFRLRVSEHACDGACVGFAMNRDQEIRVGFSELGCGWTQGERLPEREIGFGPEFLLLAG